MFERMTTANAITLALLLVAGCPSIELPQINPNNRVPMADAGPDITACVDDTVTLTAAGSSDPDGDALSYQWTQTSGQGVTLTGENSMQPSFRPTTAATYEFAVTVNDGQGGADSDTVRVNAGNCTKVDSDGDGVPDSEDNCPNTPRGTPVNDVGCPEISDCNNNGIDDSTDIATGTSRDCNGNGTPDECESDRDGDGTIDACDNCRDTYNPEQADSDADGVGDACEDNEDFCDRSHWTTFEPGAHGVGNDLEGYTGAAFDGQYVYYVPTIHGVVLRYDTHGNFSQASSWSTFDPGARGIGSPDGYAGAVFDDRYVYFVPHGRGGSVYGAVLRYDTAGGFSDASSWDAFDAGANGVGKSPRGYLNGVFDGRYIYLVPHKNSEWHGEVLRYDTSRGFSDVSSWSAFDPGDYGVGNQPDGYTGAAFDGRYVYLAPYHNNSGYHGEVLRYDTTGSVSDVSSWSTFDPGGRGVGRHTAGYAGVIAVSGYVYFVPYYDGSVHSGEVLRYDTMGEFPQASSWTAFDAESQGLGTSPAGYNGAVFDGQYIYFVPTSNGSGNYHGEVLRYDTARSFSDLSSWAACDPGAQGVGTDPDGYAGAVFDGQYIYFVPYATDNGPNGYHGEVLRYNTNASEAFD